MVHLMVPRLAAGRLSSHTLRQSPADRTCSTPPTDAVESCACATALHNPDCQWRSKMGSPAYVVMGPRAQRPFVKRSFSRYAVPQLEWTPGRGYVEPLRGGGEWGNFAGAPMGAGCSRPPSRRSRSTAS